METINSQLHFRLVDSMYRGPQIFHLDCGSGIYSYISDLSDSSSNFAGFALHAKPQYLASVRATRKLFDKHKAPFCWICEDVREAELAVILENLGFTKIYSFWGMSQNRQDLLPAPNHQVFVEEEITKGNDFICTQV